ncbi:unnamed protein product [Rhodiola kirilowii]
MTTDTDALQFILNVMQNSPFVEVKGDKLRKRTDWEKYYSTKYCGAFFYSC